MLHEDVVDTRARLTKADYDKLKTLCQSVSDFIYQHYSPHTSVVITTDDFVVKEDMLNGYLEM